MRLEKIEVKDLRCFLILARIGNLSRAAREHSLAKGTLSNALKRLESEIGLVLMERTQRGLLLTEAGRALAERAPAIFDAHDAAISAAMRAHSRIEGTVRIAAAHEFGASVLGTAALEVARKVPSLDFELQFYPADTMFRQLVDFDCMIFFGEPPATWLVARKLGEVHYGVYAAPQFARTLGPVRDGTDLRNVAGVDIRRNGLSENWVLENAERSVTVRYRPRFRVSDYWMARLIAQSEEAAAYLPTFFVEHDVRSGVLWPLLEGWRSPPHGVYLLYPPSKKGNPRVSMVVDELERGLRTILFNIS